MAAAMYHVKNVINALSCLVLVAGGISVVIFADALPHQRPFSVLTSATSACCDWHFINSVGNCAFGNMPLQDQCSVENLSKIAQPNLQRTPMVHWRLLYNWRHGRRHSGGHNVGKFDFASA
jgi:hypothetical protein